MKKTVICKHKGLTLLEMVLGAVVLFMVTMILGQLLITGLFHHQRTKAYSTAAMLASGIAERNLGDFTCTDYDTYRPFDSPFSDYNYCVNDLPFNEYLRRRTVVVTRSGGVIIKNDYLHRITPGILGVSTDPDSSVVTLSNSNNAGRDIESYDSKQPMSDPLLTIGPDFPSLPFTIETISSPDPPAATITKEVYGTPAGLAQDQYGSIFWVADQNLWRYLHWIDGILPAPDWTPVDPEPKASAINNPTGIATDYNAAVIWAGNAVNRAIRPYYTASSNWGNRVVLPSAGIPAGVATDMYGNFVYVANTEHYIQIYDTIDRTWISSFQPIPGGKSPNNMLRGIAVTGLGEIIWAADTVNLYKCTGTACNIEAALPFDLAEPYNPSNLGDSITINSLLGMATDRYGSLVWLHDKDGPLYVYNPITGSFTNVAP